MQTPFYPRIRFPLVRDEARRLQKTVCVMLGDRVGAGSGFPEQARREAGGCCVLHGPSVNSSKVLLNSTKPHLGFP